MIKFNNIEDVWDYMNELKFECESKGSKFNILQDIYEQLPFFVCNNHILKQEYQQDISMYMYCKETGVPPYKGSYNEQPKLWLQKYYIIKSALDIRTDIMKEKKNG